MIKVILVFIHLQETVAARATSHRGGAALHENGRVAEGGESSPWKGVPHVSLPTLLLRPSRCTR